jgi:uncharacterized protein (UPF0147 family)
MELKDLASISGKPGLFRIIKPARASVIVETLDEQKKKMVVSANQRISILDEISIYTNTTEGSTPLIEVLQKIHEEYGTEMIIENDATQNEYLAFFKTVLPDFDQDKVYPSDIKKIVRWYEILLNEAPQLITGSTDSQEEE